MNSKKILKITLFALISIVLLWFLFRYINLKQVIETFSRLSVFAVIIGLLFYILGYFIRAFRFYYLLDKKISLSILFFVVCIHNMINSLLPARIGEISYVYLLKKKGIKIAEGAATLIVSRIFDLEAILIIFAFAILLSWKKMPGIFVSIIPYAAVFLAALLFGTLLFIIFAGRINKKLFSKSKNKIIIVLSKKLSEFAEYFSKSHSKKKIAMLSVTSILLWFSQFLMIYFMLQGVLNLGFWYVVMGSLFAILSTVLPVQGISGFGTIEASWALAFIALGVSKELAIASGFVFHFVLIFYFLLLGLVGFIGFKKYKQAV